MKNLYQIGSSVVWPGMGGFVFGGETENDYILQTVPCDHKLTEYRLDKGKYALRRLSPWDSSLVVYGAK